MTPQRFSSDVGRSSQMTMPPKHRPGQERVDFLGYLESVVLSSGRTLVERVTAGKLRLCIQASIRHNDLLSTPLHMMEWCRFLGSERAAGVRAKAPRTKSGARPWVASFLGVCPAGDAWLTTTMELLLTSHGEGWKTHEFCGCAPDGDSAFFKYPSTLGTDVEIIRSMLSRDVKSGKGPVMTSEEAAAIRWHGAKATLTSYMVHFDIRTKYVRYQGGWKKASEAMPDLYLREAQSVVLKAQVQTLDLQQTRSRAAASGRETPRLPLLHIPFRQKEGRARVDPGRGGPS